jgi:hypothetical protein
MENVAERVVNSARGCSSENRTCGEVAIRCRGAGINFSDDRWWKLTQLRAWVLLPILGGVCYTLLLGAVRRVRGH